VSEIVRHVLSDTGPIAELLAGDYEPRPEQVRMALAVEQAMESRSHLLVEAGTGVGKSYAYLVPSIVRAANKGETIVIATNTIALQEQLVHKDVPTLLSTLDEHRGEDGAAWGGKVKAVLVKGRGNYVSIRRLKLASERQERLFADAGARRSLHVIEDWAYGTEDGTLSTLPALERPGVWDKVQSDSGNCMGRKCPTYDRCFYQLARREMESANILICNHALFFSDLALRIRGVGLLPKYDQVVLDEAHNVEDVAAEHFGLSLSEGRVYHLLSTLYARRSRKGYLAQGSLSSAGDDLVGAAIESVMRAESAAKQFFMSLAMLGEASQSRNGRVREPDVVDNPLTHAMNDVVLRLSTLREEIKNEVDRYELNAYVMRARSIADEAEALVAQTVPGCVYWVEQQRPGEGRGASRVTMACSPVEIAPLLKEHLFGKEHGVVLTSATLATKTVEDDEPSERQEIAFAHAITRLGCEGASTLQLGSPFDYVRQMQVFVDRSMPSPKGGNDRAITDALCERIMDHVAATDGGAFVLFTSFRSLNAVAERLRGPLEAVGNRLLAQGQDGSRTQMLEAFREDDRAVLFGAASFWQGVDVRGHGLRNVIITRLPFEPPDRPLTEARLERITERGGDPFREDSLPRAVIRFKQGIGRLIRSSSDKGRVVVLDPRVVTTGYGRQFLKALPEGIELQVLTE